MLLESLHVENFRSLRKLDLEKLGRVNLLLGKNNSGKTSVLEALYALANVEDPDWIDDLSAQRGLEESVRSFRHIFYQFDQKNSIAIDGRYAQAPKRVPSSLGIKLETYDKQRHPSRRNAGPQPELLLTIRLAARSPITIEVARDPRYQSIDYRPRSEDEERWLEEGLPEPLQKRNRSLLLQTAVELPLVSEQIEDLTVNKSQEKLLRVMQQLDPRIENIALGSNNQIYLDLGNAFSMLLPVNLMGQGIQRLLSVVAAMASLSGGTAFIDEIDNGLHYSALRVLWQGILAAAKEYDVQVFATTHSAEALRHLTAVLDDDQWAEHRDEVAVYTLVRADDDTVRSYRYDYEQLEFALERDVEIR